MQPPALYIVTDQEPGRATFVKECQRRIRGLRRIEVGGFDLPWGFDELTNEEAEGSLLIMLPLSGSQRQARIDELETLALDRGMAVYIEWIDPIKSDRATLVDIVSAVAWQYAVPESLLSGEAAGDAGRLSSFGVYIDPGEAPDDLIADFLVALSDLQIAHGGEGLKFTSTGTGVVASEVDADA